MSYYHRRPTRLLISAIICSLLLCACGKQITGTYKDANSNMSLDFKDDGKVYAKLVGLPVVMDYEERDDKIVVHGSEGDMFIDIIDNKTLSISHPLSSLTEEFLLIRE